MSRRSRILLIAWLSFVLGLLGVIFPFLPAWLLFSLTVALLAMVSETAQRFRDWLGRLHPVFARAIEAAEHWIEENIDEDAREAGEENGSSSPPSGHKQSHDVRL